MSTSPATGARTRNRRGEGARLRDDILAAATALLDEAGTEEAVTLRAVARRAGISAPSIYAHFADRQAILLALVRNAFTELTQRLQDANDVGDRPVTAGEGLRSPTARLLALCDAYLDFAAHNPQRYRVMFGGLWNAQNAMASGSVSPEDVRELGQAALSIISTCLRDCVAAGHSTSTDAEADSVALWLGLHGLAHQRTVSADFPWPGDIQERVVTPLAHLIS